MPPPPCSSPAGRPPRSPPAALPTTTASAPPRPRPPPARRASARCCAPPRARCAPTCSTSPRTRRPHKAADRAAIKAKALAGGYGIRVERVARIVAGDGGKLTAALPASLKADLKTLRADAKGSAARKQEAAAIWSKALSGGYGSSIESLAKDAKTRVDQRCAARTTSGSSTGTGYRPLAAPPARATGVSASNPLRSAWIGGGCGSPGPQPLPGWDSRSGMRTGSARAGDGSMRWCPRTRSPSPAASPTRCSCPMPPPWTRPRLDPGRPLRGPGRGRPHRPRRPRSRPAHPARPSRRPSRADASPPPSSGCSTRARSPRSCAARLPRSTSLGLTSGALRAGVAITALRGP